MKEIGEHINMWKQKTMCSILPIKKKEIFAKGNKIPL